MPSCSSSSAAAEPAERGRRHAEITRARPGTVNGLEVVDERDFDPHRKRTKRELTGIQPSNRLDVRLRGRPGGTILVTVEAVQSCGSESIEIASPASNSILTESPVLVRGTVPAGPAGGEVGVTVNGVVALVADGEFGALVPVDAQTTGLTAVATDGTTTLGTDTIPVTVQLAAPDRSPLRLMATPAVGLAPLVVTFTVAGDVPLASVALDRDGDGTVDFQGPSLDGLAFTYGSPGLFVPRVTVTEQTGAVRSAVALVRVYDRAGLDALLQAKWQALKNALRAGDAARALGLVAGGKRAVYGPIFGDPATQANVDQILTDITFVDHVGIRSDPPSGSPRATFPC